MSAISCLFVIYLDTVVYLVEIQILSQGDEASLLTGEFHAHLCLLLAQFGEADACVDGATSINHLLCLEGEIIAEVGRFQPWALLKSRSVIRAFPM